MLGAGKQEPEPKLLLLMEAQNKDKYHKWLFRVLLLLSDLVVSFCYFHTPEEYSSDTHPSVSGNG